VEITRELTQDECDELGIDAVAFTATHGHAVTLADLSEDELEALGL
jgi:hypothetical protein